MPVIFWFGWMRNMRTTITIWNTCTENMGMEENCMYTERGITATKKNIMAMEPDITAMKQDITIIMTAAIPTRIFTVG